MSIVFKSLKLLFKNLNEELPVAVVWSTILPVIEVFLLPESISSVFVLFTFFGF